MERLLVFGAGMIADVVLNLLRETGRYEPVALVVDAGYELNGPHSSGLPVLVTEAAVDQFPPGSAAAFVAIGYHGCNDVRAERMERLKSVGYALPPLVSPQAVVAASVGLGPNSMVMGGASLQSGAQLGEGTFVFSGAAVGHHARIGPCCWIASGAAIGGGARLGPNCFVGLNATIGNGVTIGRRCLVGAATLVTRDAPDESVFATAANDPLRIDTTRFLTFSRLR